MPHHIELVHMLGAPIIAKVKSRFTRLGLALILASSAFLIGLPLRWLFREHATSDAALFFIPWCQFVHDHGIESLREPFTNYAPFYSYLLLIAVQFDKFAGPLTLVKAISAVFELGSAIVFAEMVWRSTNKPLRAALAFSGAWLAPTVLINGSVWGQADSIWTFFVLLSVSFSMRDRNGMLPFALAVSVKAQGIFLAPFVLGMMLRRRMHLAWLLMLPAVYVIVALPVLLAGRPFTSVVGVYLAQAETFHNLSMNAANLWVFAGHLPYAVGVALGLTFASFGGGALSLFVARSQRLNPELGLLIACASLLLMPFLLPKMHDRYFYAFEVASIALACLNPRYLAFAFLAQVDGVLAYAAFEPGTTVGVLPAALCNTLLGCYLALDLRHGKHASRWPLCAWIGCASSGGALLAYVLTATSPSAASPLAMLLVGLFVSMAFLLLNGSLRPRIFVPSMPIEAGTALHS